MPWFWQALLLLIFVVPVFVLFAYAVWDVIRRPDAGLGLKAVWFVAFSLLPIIGPLVYLMLRPPGTTAAQRDPELAASVATSQGLATLAELHDRGKLTDHEYQIAKSREVGVDLDPVGPASVRQQRGSQV
jgi:hypothetical protein